MPDLDQISQAYCEAICSGIVPEVIYTIEGCEFQLNVVIVGRGCHFKGKCGNDYINILVHIGENFKKNRSHKWIASLRGVVAHELCHLYQIGGRYLPYYGNEVTVKTVIDYFKDPWELRAFTVGIGERNRYLRLSPDNGFASWWKDCAMYWLKQGKLPLDDILKVKRSIQPLYINSLRRYHGR